MALLDVVELQPGKWAVMMGEDVCVQDLSNAQAWRWVDRHLGESVSRSESVGEWIWQEKLNA